MSDATKNALLLIASVENALARGCKHYDASGNLLATPLQIILALKQDGQVTIIDPDPTPSH